MRIFILWLLGPIYFFFGQGFVCLCVRVRSDSFFNGILSNTFAPFFGGESVLQTPVPLNNTPNRCFVCF